MPVRSGEVGLLGFRARTRLAESCDVRSGRTLEDLQPELGRDREEVVEEIRLLHDKYGVKVVLLTDEYPTHSSDRWEEILDRLIALNREIYILMETRAPDIVRDRNILKKKGLEA